MSISDALDRSLDAQQRLDKDEALAELARAYAQAIDDGNYDLIELGPKLLQVLDALLLTPKSRKTIAARKGSTNVTTPTSPAATNPLDELRRRRGARVNNA